MLSNNLMGFYPQIVFSVFLMYFVKPQRSCFSISFIPVESRFLMNQWIGIYLLCGWNSKLSPQWQKSLEITNIVFQSLKYFDSFCPKASVVYGLRWPTIIGTTLKLSPRTCFRYGICIYKLCYFSSSFFAKFLPQISLLRTFIALQSNSYSKHRLLYFLQVFLIMCILKSLQYQVIYSEKDRAKRPQQLCPQKHSNIYSSKQQQVRYTQTLHEGQQLP